MKNIPKCSPFTVRKTFLFPGKFQTHRFSWLRRTVVSSEKIIRFQSISPAAWAQSRRFSVKSGFDIDRLNLVLYSFNCLLTDVYILSLEDTLYGACVGGSEVTDSLIDFFRCAPRSSNTLRVTQIFRLFPSVEPILYSTLCTLYYFCNNLHTKFCSHWMMR